jgi:hypothetical protein
MVSVACNSLVDIEGLILRSAEGASRRMVQKQRDRSRSYRLPRERRSRPLRVASGRGGELGMCSVNVSRETGGA